VDDNVPSVSIVIPARPGQQEIKALTASRALDYPANKLEIILARGSQPSAQRNAAMKAADGELVYFLDDDSLPQVENLKRGVAHFKQPEVKMVGGPNLCPPDAPWLEQVFALVLKSWLGFFSSRARYAVSGEVRETSEKELILCNLLARRDAMLELGGFNEALYPNEENALMDELQKGGGKLLYDPQFFVYRRPRSSLKAFARMLMTYGRGRAEQFRLHPTFGSAPNFVPPLFLLYLISIAPVLLLAGPIGKLIILPLALYALAVLGQVIVLATSDGLLRSIAALPLIVSTHIFYGWGFWRGLFTKLSPPIQRTPTPVALERISVSAEGSILPQGNATGQKS